MKLPKKRFGVVLASCLLLTSCLASNSCTLCGSLSVTSCFLAVISPYTFDLVDDNQLVLDVLPASMSA